MKYSPATMPRKAVEYSVYKIVVRQGDHRGLIVGRFEVAAPDRHKAQGAGERWAMARGMEPDFNCHVTVMRKMHQGEWTTIMVVP